MKKHQIITLGKENISVYHGLKESNPDVVHFLLTEFTASHHLALVDMLPEKTQWKTYMVKPYDGYSVIDTCEMIHRDNEGDFMYNLSEGTKIMTIAALSVAKKHKATPVFLTQTGDIVNLENYSSSPMQTPLSNTEILNLSGSRLWTYQSVVKLSYSDIQTANKIKEFIERYGTEYQRIQKAFRHSYRKQIQRLPAKLRIDNDLIIDTFRGRVQIYKNKLPLLNLNHTNSSFLMFGGRWWEAIVASYVKIWTENQDHKIEAWQSVIFQANSEEEKVKNEVDILINNRNNLIFLECKSGFISQDDVYKIDSVRETYGGDKNIAALASYYPLDPLIKEKCNDLGINVFAPDTEEERIGFVKTLPRWLTNISKTIVI